MQTISLDNEKNISLEEKLDQLDSLGFNNKRKRNEKLLKRTNGNVEVVRNFLLAKEQLKESSKRQKSERKIEKHKKKFGNDRKERKKNYEKFRKKILKLKVATIPLNKILWMLLKFGQPMLPISFWMVTICCSC